MQGKAESDLRLTLGVLLVVYIFNFLDRQVIAILAEPIAKDLSLSDTQIGLMTGLAFALFYTVLGLPIARYADNPNTNRVKLIAVAVAVWSGFTAVSGFVQNFTQMLAARIGVGVGEAGCTPPAHSLISDKAPPGQRARAMSIYQLGPPIGSLIGMAFGGLMADSMGWRSAFIAVGLPGLAVALAVIVLVRDPRMAGVRSTLSEVKPGADTQNLTYALRQIWASKAMRFLLIASPLASFGGYGIMIWTAIFFQRTHGMTPGEAGVSFGLVYGIGMALGIWAGGHHADRHAPTDKRHALTAPAVGLFLSTPFIMGALLVPQAWLALLLLLPGNFFANLYIGALYSAVHGLVPTSTRAVSSAVILFLQNLIGLGLGPLVLGYFSDVLKPEMGDDSVRYVLLFAAGISLIGGAAMWAARHYLPHELGRHE